jgi:hypothetical protein
MWQSWKGELMRWWLSDPSRYGSRPAAWWRFETSEGRALLGGHGILVEQRFRNLRVPLDRGLPMYHEVAVDDPPAYESEAEFLRRLGLLTDDERARLTACDFESVAVVD